MQFKNREELLKFEANRKQYYDNWFKETRTTIGFYKQLFLETFHPEYRALRKKYENYLGGWYKDDNNIIYTNCMGCLSGMRFEPGTIVVDISNGDELAYEGVYVGQ